MAEFATGTTTDDPVSLSWSQYGAARIPWDTLDWAALPALPGGEDPDQTAEQVAKTRAAYVLGLDGEEASLFPDWPTLQSPLYHPHSPSQAEEVAKVCLKTLALTFLALAPKKYI